MSLVGQERRNLSSIARHEIAPLVFGASNSGWPCSRDKTFAEAKAICEAAGARLCTAAELAAGCTAGTGCQFDFELIWGTA